MSSPPFTRKLCPLLPHSDVSGASSVFPHGAASANTQISALTAASVGDVPQHGAMQGGWRQCTPAEGNSCSEVYFAPYLPWLAPCRHEL